MVRPPVKRVAIIGAGASGLTAIKTCLEEGVEPICLERRDDIGGLWNYMDEAVADQACVAKSTIINTSKEMMCYSDFPIPKEFPIFMHSSFIQKYFKMYIENFGLMKYIKFGREIIQVSHDENYEKNGRWFIKVRDCKTGEETSDVYDAVLLCTGHHASVNKPTFPGLESFKGEVFHAHDYKTPYKYVDKKILIIGFGNSGVDIAVELGRFAEKLFVSTRRGAWLFNRVQAKGHPLDMGLSRASMMVPLSIKSYMFEKVANKRLDHELYRMKPATRAIAQHPLVNDDLPNSLASGRVRIKPNVLNFTEDGVKFEDGTFEEVDVVILATGYVFGFPYLDESIFEVKKNRVSLFKLMFPPDLIHPTLATVGFIQPLGAIFPISEMHCRVALKVFKGETELPSRGDMWDDINKKRVDMAARYVTSMRHTIQVDYITHMDELAEIIGCKPDLGKLFLSDPVLAYHVLFGAATPYQYRLHGPNPWHGARAAILSQWDRTVYQISGGKRQTSSGSCLWWIKLILVVVVFAYIAGLL